MVADIFLEIAIFVFLMLIVGIVLTVYEFEAHVMDHEEQKKEQDATIEKK